MTKFSHLTALEAGLSHERVRLQNANRLGERALRLIWIAQREREIAAERKFLGLDADPVLDMTEDEVLAELGA